MLRCSLVFLIGCLCSTALSAPHSVITLQPPGRSDYARIDPAGASVIPSGRSVTPAGKSVSITHDPFGLAISPDGTMAVCLHSKVITLIDTSHPEKAVRYPTTMVPFPRPYPMAPSLGWPSRRMVKPSISAGETPARSSSSISPAASPRPVSASTENLEGKSTKTVSRGIWPPVTMENGSLSSTARTTVW